MRKKDTKFTFQQVFRKLVSKLISFCGKEAKVLPSPLLLFPRKHIVCFSINNMMKTTLLDFQESHNKKRVICVWIVSAICAHRVAVGVWITFKNSFQLLCAKFQCLLNETLKHQLIALHATLSARSNGKFSI